jgi:hypothetical protein
MLPRPIPLLRLSAAHVTGVVLTVLALGLAAWWLSQLLAPRPLATLPVAANQTRAVVGVDAALRLFDPAVTVATADSSLINGVRLTGIYSGPQGRGFASFQTPAGARGVLPGQEIQSGLVLSRLHPDHVVVLAGHQEIRLSLTPTPPSPNKP